MYIIYNINNNHNFIITGDEVFTSNRTKLDEEVYLYNII